ncbi:MAG TPA: TIGR03885 family FMN-dependent LLM class oxidoreductase [Cytophagaceae bacterium]|nr:TIGR03885 family FMN-dependent LLM class oxidoreductase [Cytophagaceae bacterium]
MSILSYHAAHEQFAPSALLAFAKEAERAGFDACHCSDHFHPWSLRQGQSGFSFSWLGAAMEATSFPFSMVNAPGQRYHPAIVAQALATLTEMYPGRLDVALGTGEAVNELINGETWPEKPVRNQRLLECVTIIRRLLAGETVTHEGLVKVKEATLFTRPNHAPKLLAAAITAETAYWAGSWADGLLTIYQSSEKMGKVISAFKEGGGEGKPLHVQMSLSYARNHYEAIEEAYDQWRSNLAGIEALENLSRPEQYDEATKHITREEIQNCLLISSNPSDYIIPIRECSALGFENIILHNVNRQQIAFIQDFGATVLPALRKTELKDRSTDGVII